MKTMVTTFVALIVAATVYDANANREAGGSFFLTSNFSEAADVLRMNAVRGQTQGQN